MSVLGLTQALAPSSPAAASPSQGERVLDLRTGQSYTGGTRVRAPFLGISFVVPDGWRATLGAEARVLHLESAAKPGTGIVLLLQDVTAEAVEARLREPQAFEESFVLHPTGLFLSDGKTWLATYAGRDTFGTAAALLGPALQAVIYLLAGPGEEAAYYGELLARLTASTRFESTEGAGLLRDWYPRLAGMVLSRPLTGSGSDTQVWHLCHDGRFHFARFRGNQPGRGDAIEEATGDWRVEASGGRALLVLSPQTGISRSLTLSLAEDKPALNGEPVSSAVSDVCP